MTAPFGPVLEAALKENVQGGRLSVYKGVQVHPQFFCCISGTSVGVAKDPVAVLSLSATRVCTNTALTADYSLSWSPSSTIASWEVDWGDGNVSNGSWPDSGSVTHPAGGYTLDIVYTVTLTVTDLLGATGSAEVQVEVVDCLEPEEIEVYGGCGASGAWRSNNGGISWDDVSRGVLAGVTIHDLKANWFTIGAENVEIWAATDQGVYVSTAESIWTRKALPAPSDAYPDEPTPVTIACSKYDPLEVYVLATSDTGITWLYRTTDAGETWTWCRVGLVSEGEPLGGGVNSRIDALYWDDVANKMWISTWGCYDNGLYNCNNVVYWKNSAYNVVQNVVTTVANQITQDASGNIWMCGEFYETSLDDPCENVIVQSGTNWDMRSIGVDCEANVYALAYYKGYMYGAGWNTGICKWKNSTWDSIGVVGGGSETIHALCATDKYLYAGGLFTTINGDSYLKIAKYNGSSWSALNDGINVALDEAVYTIAANNDGTKIYVGGNFTAMEGDGIEPFIARFAVWHEDTDTWDSISVGDGRLNGSVYAIAVSPTDEVYVGGTFTGTVGGDTLNYIARWDKMTNSWVQVGSGVNGPVFALAFDEDGNLWAGGNFTATGDGEPVDYIIRYATEEATPPVTGRTHLLDIDASGYYVYVALLDSDGHPVIIRVSHDLGEITNVFAPGTGTWGGVVADHFFSDVLWMFGDFGSEKILVSDDWGETYQDCTDASWNANEVVRPLLPSDWDPNDVIAILNFANESWRTRNWGENWVKQGDTAFDCACGARDPFEPDNVWIGREDTGANHIQYSPNAGVNWQERSSGFTNNAPVTALQVTK